ncbi:monovalent cation:proton antiporter family protein [Pelomicrobium methylotrophicum]|nr:monovalent cation:proton antiporter family protein [Pelomicrobium methylotrophicum]
MMPHDSLEIALIVLAAAVAVVVAFRRLDLPPLLGYLLVGILVGPHTLGWVAESAEASYLAEFGVVFLMFTIGLEFNLPRLRTMRGEVFGFGASQVIATIVLVMLLSMALGASWQSGFAIGAVLCMSSTAILGKMLAERLELNAPHGRKIIGAALFQDLAVVPLLIAIPALARPGEELAWALALAVVKATAVLFVILVLGQRLMRRWYHLVARQKSSELFILNVLLTILGLAFLTERAGLSLALGAFLAGVLISETEYRYQVEEDIRPFREVLLGFFFVTIGMLLDWKVVFANWIWVGATFALLVGAKGALVAALSRLLGADPGVALRTGLSLAHAGEFGFVLLQLAGRHAVVDANVMQSLLAGMVLSMLAAPFLIQHSERLVRRFAAGEWMARALELHRIAVQTMSAEGHVIICGYGRSGQNLARILEREAIPFIALDLDPQRIREAAAAGESVVYGDAARREVLIAAGLKRAKAMVITYANTASALRVLSVVHRERPDLPVLVRTLDDADIDVLKRAGAAEVVSEIMEGSLMLGSHALMLVGVPLNRVLRRIREARQQRYALFRGFFRGESDEVAESPEKPQPRLHSVLVTQGAAAVGRPLQQLRLEELDVEVTAIRRRGIRGLAPTPQTRLEEGDVVVLLGTPEALAAAEMRLLQG